MEVAVRTPEQLVAAAHSQHGRAAIDSGNDAVALRLQVLRNERLLTILAAADVEEIEVTLRDGVADAHRTNLELVSSLERALDRGLELTPAGDELVVLPTYTAMLALRKIVAERGFVRPYWERAA